jgi:hypothetical protein
VGPADPPEWERLLAAERHLQALVPGALLVGGCWLAALASLGEEIDWSTTLPRDDGMT